MLSPDEATLWTAVAAAGGAVLGAFIAAAVTVRITKRSVTSAETMAAKQRQHERELVVEKRDQDRLLDAYMAIQRHVMSWVESVGWRIRLYETDPPTPQPVGDPLDSEAGAIASLVASPEVDQLLVSFNRLVRAFLVSVRRSEDARAAGVGNYGMADPNAHRDMTEAGEAVIAKGLDLNNQMRTELGRSPHTVEMVAREVGSE
jgi:hypothetical protein